MTKTEIQNQIESLIDEIDGIDLQIAEKNVWQAKATHAKRIKSEQLTELRVLLKAVKKEEVQQKHIDHQRNKNDKFIKYIKDCIGKDRFIEIARQFDEIESEDEK